jgi:hypothetical protein
VGVITRLNSLNTAAAPRTELSVIATTAGELAVALAERPSLSQNTEEIRVIGLSWTVKLVVRGGDQCGVFGFGHRAVLALLIPHERPALCRDRRPVRPAAPRSACSPHRLAPSRRGRRRRSATTTGCMPCSNAAAACNRTVCLTPSPPRRRQATTVWYSRTYRNRPPASQHHASAPCAVQSQALTCRPSGTSVSRGGSPSLHRDCPNAQFMQQSLPVHPAVVDEERRDNQQSAHNKTDSARRKPLM